MKEKIYYKVIIVAICYFLQVDNRENAEKEIAISTVSSSTQVSCPLCDQDFPPTKIERHAMYCNGIGPSTGKTSQDLSNFSLHDSFVILYNTVQEKQTTLPQS